MRLVHAEVKEDECLWHELCVDELPEIFESPEDGPVRVRPEALNFYLTLEPEIRRVATDICPIDAIYLRYDDGTEVSPPVPTDPAPVPASLNGSQSANPWIRVPLALLLIAIFPVVLNWIWTFFSK